MLKRNDANTFRHRSIMTKAVIYKQNTNAAIDSKVSLDMREASIIKH